MDPDKLNGMIWGAICASSIGLPFHGKEASDSPTSGFPDGYFRKMPETACGKHPIGSWSALLEPAFLALQALRETEFCGSFQTEVDNSLDTHQLSEFIRRFADKLRTWCDAGFPEWRDASTPYDQDFHTLAVVKVPGFLERPLVSASQVDLRSPNDCSTLSRILAACVLPSAEHAEQVCMFLIKATHRTPSISGVACFAALLLQGMLYGTQDDELIKYAYSRLGKHVSQGPQFDRLHKIICDKPLREIGGRDNIGRHVASLRCFLYAYRCIRGTKDVLEKTDLPPPLPKDLWEKVIGKIAIEGGAADMNCALAGALLGAKYGMAVVPSWYNTLPHADWVKRQIEDFQSKIYAPRNPTAI